MDLFNKILAYEAGELDREEFVELFQDLIDSGLLYHLQGHYGRVAQALINSGEVTCTR